MVEGVLRVETGLGVGVGGGKKKKVGPPNPIATKEPTLIAPNLEFAP